MTFIFISISDCILFYKKSIKIIYLLSCNKIISPQNKMFTKEVQMTETTGRDDIHEQEHSDQKAEASDNPNNQRRHQPIGIFIAVVFFQTLTIFLSLLLKLTPLEYKKYMYLSFIILTVVRCSVFLGSSIQLIGCSKKLIKLYFLLDNTFLVMIGSIITYIYLNSSSTVEFAIGGMICYPFLLFFMVGNFRVMLKYCDWKPVQVIIYKLVKIIGSTYFLIYGTVLIIKTDDSTNTDLLMLWVFTTCGFWAEMCFCINSFDASDGLSTKYRLMDD